MELIPSGSTYKAVENEFLRLHNPDIHLTDVMEDPRDGSLLLLDTGGWFRIGCPSSLMAKSDLLGAVYRIKSKAPVKELVQSPTPAPLDLNTQIANLKSADPQIQLRACQAIAEAKQVDKSANRILDRLLVGPLDPALEHAVITAIARLNRPQAERWFMDNVMAYDAMRRNRADKEKIARIIEFFGDTRKPVFLARVLRIGQILGVHDTAFTNIFKLAFSSRHEVQIDAAFFVLEQNPQMRQLACESLADEWKSFHSSRDAAVKGDPVFGREYLKKLPELSARLRTKIQRLAVSALGDESAQTLVTLLLAEPDSDFCACGLSILATQTAGATNDAWLPALDKLLAESPTPLVFDAIKKLKSPHFDTALQAIANDTKRPLAIRLKALDSAKSVKLTGETFTMVKGVLADVASSAAAKIQAAGMIASAPLAKPQLLELAPLFATLGPVELKTLLGIVRKSKEPEVGRALASEIAKNPVIASQQESVYRTAFSDQPPEIFETIILPAYNAAVAATEAKKRQLGPLADKVVASGNVSNGKKNFELGKGTCIACHKISEAGRPIGPDLSHIGSIRTERDLLESILFPSNTLARDYEAHVIETSDGQQTLGVIKSHTAEGLLVIDIAGQEKNIAHQTIAGDTTLPTSLMPQGLDQTMPEADLLDLVAWLRSLK